MKKFAILALAVGCFALPPAVFAAAVADKAAPPPAAITAEANKAENAAPSVLADDKAVKLPPTASRAKKPSAPNARRTSKGGAEKADALNENRQASGDFAVGEKAAATAKKKRAKAPKSKKSTKKAARKAPQTRNAPQKTTAQSKPPRAVRQTKNYLAIEVNAAPKDAAIIPDDWGGATIYGLAIAREEQCVRFLLEKNPLPLISVTPEELVHYYFVEGEREGIRGDVAFCQAIKETGFFGYGGTVTPDQNNYCGLGTTSATVKGCYFPTAEIGVRAHIQHLLAYIAKRRPAAEIVDPRFDLVRKRYGNTKIRDWPDLNGRWAVPGFFYGESILQIFREVLKR